MRNKLNWAIGLGYFIGSLWGFGHYWNNTPGNELEKPIAAICIAILWPYYAASVIMKPAVPS
jgi:hypothetical protein